ncbi:MAG: TPM domain-containing protein [Opitutaceae bacterium]
MSLFSSTPPIDDARVTNAIAAAETRTSGEIRVLLSRGKAPNPVSAAQAHFERLGMKKTAARNGVLIYLSPSSRTFAIIGDTGIHEKCGDAFWRLLAAAMEARFKKGEFTEGLVEGIEHAGKLLAENFPRLPDDRNELPDKIERAE